jgi:hypothetical protein
MRRRVIVAVITAVTAVGGWAAVPAVPAASAAPAPASPPQRIDRPVAFIDNFDNGRTDGWASRTLGTRDGPANWHVTSGQLVQSSNVFGGTRDTLARPGTMLVAGDQGWTNYDYSVRARTSDNDEFGVVFRYQNHRNFYRFTMDAQRHERQLVKRVDGVYSVLAQDSSGYTPGAWYTLRVVAVGGRLQIYVNGRTVFDVTDASLGWGRIGLYTWGCPTTFDDVSAQVESDDFFTIAVMPDTQLEVQSDPPELAAETRWLSTNRANLHLAAVLQEGDVVNVMNSARQWNVATRYFRYLDGKVPFSIAAGNHDTFDLTTKVLPRPVDPAPFNAFIGRLADYRVGGQFASGSYLNTFRLLSAGGVRLLILNLQFGAPDDVLDWAAGVVDRHPGRHVLLLTHDYLGSDNLVRGPDVPGGSNDLPSYDNPGLNDPTAIWEKFVSVHPNVQFVFNGHVIDPTSPTEPWSVGRLVSANSAGRSVFQTLTNYQTYQKGLGYLRLFRFYPSEGTVSVTNYSPFQDTYLTDPDDQFSYTGVDLGSWPPSS